MTINFAPGDLVRARGREWVALPSPRDGVLALRPLSGGENDTVILDPVLELLPVEPARFDLPADATVTVQAKAALLADAIRLTLRRGAGPFRSAAQLAFEPRTYQLVPLLMALRLSMPRLLIADDVGIGKTIEAGLILRELMDRGEVDAFSVLCPPHLVEQWVGELKARFGIDAVPVTSGTASRLERGLPLTQTLFDAYPFTIVSLDYIKAEKRREGFARACPDFVIVDEAHACVGTHQGRQQRFELLSGLARNPERRMILLTATPHSGDEEAFARLLSLVDPSFASMDFEDMRYREHLARHLVQRRRIDLVSGDWDEDRAFPKHETTEFAYRLSDTHRAFQEAVLDYCFGIVSRAGSGQGERRLAFWGTLALMRCVGSSPAAALSALRNRMSSESERLEPQIYDDDGDDEDAVDLEPGTAFEADPELLALVKLAEELACEPDPKLAALVDALIPLIKKGANPVVFCRYIATAEHVRDGLRKAFPRLTIEAVTGVLTPEERRDRVADMATAEDEKPGQRILVATDCLSEGINLQQLFDTVVHYDLSWNPTRHQQREGRVDRFGQPAELVRSIMMFSPDSAIDGAVLDVILRKAEEIRKATGVTVPLPEERGPVTDALMASMMLRHGVSPRRTAAIDSLKVIAFDLACLCLSIEGATRVPAFMAELGLPAIDMPGPGKSRFVFADLGVLYAALSRVYELAVSLPDAPLREFEAHVADLPRTTEAERLVIQRIGQDIFRTRLMDYWQGRCPLTTSTRRARMLPAFVIPPRLTRSPVELSDGTRPRYAISCGAVSKRRTSPISTTKVTAEINAMPRIA